MRAGVENSIVPELWRFQELLRSLTWRDLRVRYKQSLLGMAWAIVLPLSMMLVFTFVFTRAIDAGAALKIDIPSALYAYTGLVPWMFFSVSLGGCVNSLVANRNLVTKVYFPREVFPISCVAGAFVDFCIASAVLTALVAYYHFTGPWRFVPTAWILLVPAIVTIQILLTVGIGLPLAMANLFYRDVRPIFSVAIQLMMFVSAVVVPVPHDGSVLARLISINPMVPILSAYRDCLINGRSPGWAGLAYSSGVAVAILIVGWALFRRASYRFAECI